MLMNQNPGKSIQELEKIKIELEMKRNYFGEFTINVLHNDLKEHYENFKEDLDEECTPA
ncbi:hypothetical protein RV10_GL001946 [Enterococcus pallens]|nr:hypothetical protein RV10_GL001946 [Enterococcus pallens]